MYIVYIHGTQISTSIFWKSGPQENKTSTPTKRKKHERVPGIYIYIYILFIHIYIDPFMVHVPSPILVDPGISSHSEAPALCPRPQLPKNFNGWWVKSSPLFFSKVFFSWKSLALGGLNSHEGCILAQTWEANCFSFICFVFFLAWRGQWHFKRHPWHEKPKRTYLSTSQIQSTFTRWYPTSCKWSYNFYKWPYKIGNWDYNRYMWTYNRPHLITGFSVPTL